ncbi:MAG: flagellar motor switch protein FliM [Actinomycetota bacterium]|nr:flagellar motor switch protein FliM [Actinomycetota bacterium]
MKEEFLEAKVFTIKKHPLVLDDYGEHLNINEFDFKKPSKFSKEQIRIFELIHNTFANLAETKISMTARDVLGISLIMTEKKIYSEYLASLKEQSLLVVLKSSVLDADIILQFSNLMFFILIDKILGGDGEAEIKRDFTEIEMNLVEEIINIFIQSLDESWSTAEKMEFMMKNIENNAQYIRIVPLNEMCLVFNFKIEIAGKLGFFTICMPFISVKPVLDDLNKRSFYSGDPSFFSKDRKERLSDGLNLVKIEMAAVLGCVDLNLKEINNLEAGDILRLGKKTSDDIEMLVEESKLFKIRPGKISNKLAVKIIEKFETGG